MKVKIETKKKQRRHFLDKLQIHWFFCVYQEEEEDNNRPTKQKNDVKKFIKKLFG